jgi:beta-carotene 3-hydroxylase
VSRRGAALATTIAAAAATELLAAVAHRRVMHAGGWGWHRSHHAGRVAQPSTRARLERNDLYPVTFAAVTIGGIALGSGVPRLRALRWIGAGVTAYGAAYLLVHDVCIHGRLTGAPIVRGRYLRHVAAAHAQHHRDGAAPYGFLVPVARSGRPAA